MEPLLTLEPIHAAVVEGNIEMVEELLTNEPSCVEKRTSKDENVLHLAMKKGETAVVKMLLERLKIMKIESLLTKRNEEGNTPLYVALIHENYSIAKMLLEDDLLKPHLCSNTENNGKTTEEIIEELKRFLQEGENAVQQNIDMDVLHPQQPQGNIRTLSTASSVSDNILMAVASLLASTTYQAILSPPGGVWSDDTPLHSAGKSVWGTNHSIWFLVYVIGNSVAFFFSLCSLISLLKSDFLVLMCLLGFTFTFANAAVSITPYYESQVFLIGMFITFVLLCIFWFLKDYFKRHSYLPVGVTQDQV